MSDTDHLGLAIELAVEAAGRGDGPFAAIVVDAGGSVVGQGTNRVIRERDPSAHAELVALRQAARAMENPDLSGCVLYASCHPCPMCLAAAWWARVARIVYAAEPEDAAAAGFDDVRFWDAMHTGTSIVTLDHVEVDGAAAPFEAWLANPDRVPY